MRSNEFKEASNPLPNLMLNKGLDARTAGTAGVVPVAGTAGVTTTPLKPIVPDSPPVPASKLLTYNSPVDGGEPGGL